VSQVGIASDQPVDFGGLKRMVTGISVMGKEHIATLELLPWYVNDTLEGKDLELVLKHLDGCRDCQAERDRLYELQALVEESDDTPTDHEMSFRRTMRRIEASERNRDSMRDIEHTGSKRKFLSLGIAASVISMMLAGTAWLSMEEAEERQEFQTLSSDASTPSSGPAYRMELGFVNPIPATTMRQALIDTDSNIVSGPDERGNYLVEVVVPSNMTPAEYLSRIRMINGVESARFAQSQTH
jgi:hypothetical protein